MPPLSPADLAAELRPGMTVFLAGGMSYPLALVEALDAAPDSTAGVHVVSTRPAGFEEPPPRLPGGTLTVFFRTPDLDRVEGKVRFVPMQYRRIYRWLEEELEVDLLLVQLAPPDAEGRCSVGLGVDFLPAVLANAKRVVAQLNPALPAPVHAPSVPISRLDGWLEAERPLPSSVAVASEVAQRIAEHAAALIEDGVCLQTGIGAIPDAILAALRDRRDLGCHSGMISDGIRDLHQRGVLTGARKAIDRGKIVTGFALGSPELYRWAAAAKDLVLRPVAYTHDARILAQHERLVAINSAIEVDLGGQVNAETVGGRAISGVGGAVDFLRGAALSKGGRSIVALPSSARGGTVSRIVARLDGHTPATALRTDVDAVVTEHGVAWLRGRSLEERAEALLAIADPIHRDALAG